MVNVTLRLRRIAICIDDTHVSTRKDFWYDWAYFQWQGFDKPIPARIMMKIDILDFDIIHNMDQYPDTLPDDADQQNIPHLTKDKWIIVLAAEYPQTERDN